MPPEAAAAPNMFRIIIITISIVSGSGGGISG